MRVKDLVLLFVIVVFLTLKTAASSPEFEAARLLEAERALSALGYWVENVDGKPDASTVHAITAFQKVEGLKRTGKLTDDVLEALRFASRPAAQFNTGAAHVEVDMKRQVLFLTDDSGYVTRILAVSTGSGQKYQSEGHWDTAYTPRGIFKIYNKIDGVRHAPLGDIYYPSYFSGGVAIHGSNSIPAFPASHGCVRIPRYADQQFGGMTRIGMEVYVYDDNFLTREPGENTGARTGWFTPARTTSLFKPVGGLFSRMSYASLSTPFDWSPKAPAAQPAATFAFRPSMPAKKDLSNV
jgi:Putative peptidoglycan binding domain/L,D-transpeptidase catalytic domain